MRRTDFAQGMPGQFGVASFVWDADEDGPLLAGGGAYLRGEIPLGSVLIGGFAHVSRELSAGGLLGFHIGGNPETITAGIEFFGFGAANPPDHYPLIFGQLGDPTKNVLIDVEAKAKVWVYSATLTTAGQLCLYLFYVNNDLDLFGQMPTPNRRSRSPLSSPSEIRVATFAWNSSVDPQIRDQGFLRGEIPAGSVVIGGFLHCPVDVTMTDGGVSFYLGAMLTNLTAFGDGVTPAGTYGLNASRFSDPTLNVVLDIDSNLRAVVAGTAQEGRFAVYVFYVTNPFGLYGTPQRRHLTESPEARPGEMRLATFTWDEADGPLSDGTLHGEVPPGSIVCGGFAQVSKAVVVPLGAGASFSIGDDVGVFDLTGDLAVGFYALNNGDFADPGSNFLVGSTSLRSLMSVLTSGDPIVEGQLTLYLFYINNELGLHGQIASPDASQVA